MLPQICLTTEMINSGKAARIGSWGTVNMSLSSLNVLCVSHLEGMWLQLYYVLGVNESALFSSDKTWRVEGFCLGRR